MKKIVFPVMIVASIAATFAIRNYYQPKRPILNHIALSVSDLQRSTSFYSDIIGLDTIPEPFHDGRHTWYSVAEHSHLHLIKIDTKQNIPDKNTHLCFSVNSLEEMIERLNSAGVAWADWNGKPNTPTTRVDGVKQIYFQDPDGYWIEINNDKY